MYRSLFNNIKKRIPRISPTEMIALQSGNTSLDRNILEGKIVYPEKKEYITKFPNEELNSLLDSFDEKQIYPGNSDVIDHLAKKK